MDHGDHQMPMPTGPRCSMNMLWNTQIEDTCIVFRSWHVSSKTVFALSFFAIVALGVLYEWLRVAQRDVDRLIARRLIAEGKGKARVRSGRNTPSESDSEGAALLSGAQALKPKTGTPLPIFTRVIRALLYALTVFLSFFLMLVFMTYNAYLILAVVVGAGIGHFVFGSHMDINSVMAGAVDSKGMACH
ncbi:Ctr copper transporter [Wolfiporia cocos MD-104 SS10]|uniref:Copper transport protein n=1 Tax=Wolfiporia cocos (strain MD-104) TaxID=742152 RepID=A0A2H3J1L1_WOLCO|nr:Ctr copper transporter [Wolfiporia cocos MD-104 SS10]